MSARSARSKSGSRTPSAPAGILVVDKPAGMTSHDVVARVRRLLGTRKIGHAGTLDPMATGVLILGVERATKLLGHVALDSKAYVATLCLGVATSTEDAEGQVVSEVDGSEVSPEAVRAGIAELTGEIEQVPSTVSAVKVNGRRAYELARAGENVELSARPVTVSRFDLLASRTTTSTTELDVLIECSSGTYVRALARDLGERLGVGGHLTQLRRTMVGPFALAAARTLDDLESEPGLSLDLNQAVTAAFPRRDLDQAEVRALSHGQAVPAAGVAGTCGAFGPDGTAIALVRDQGRVAKPVLVLAPAS